ncbi:hypothetical protein BROUX41_006579 [Berkeleyomyces rouxiae]|uniref:uncharacterized protein n=1 Tax=Berkeleyomyces rouxiae TaxID=2035830 RepID=UPI003B829F45
MSMSYRPNPSSNSTWCANRQLSGHRDLQCLKNTRYRLPASHPRSRPAGYPSPAECPVVLALTSPLSLVSPPPSGAMAPHHLMSGQDSLGTAAAYTSAQHPPYSSQYPSHLPSSFPFPPYGSQMPLPPHAPPRTLSQGHAIMDYHVPPVQVNPMPSRSHNNKLSPKPLPPAPSSLPAKPPGLPAKPPPPASSNTHVSSTPANFKPPISSILGNKGTWNGAGNRERERESQNSTHGHGSTDRPWKKHGHKKKGGAPQKQPRPETKVETITTPTTVTNTSDIEEGEISAEPSPIASTLVMPKTADDDDKSEGEIDEDDVSFQSKTSLPWRKSNLTSDSRRERDAVDRTRDESLSIPNRPPSGRCPSDGDHTPRSSSRTCRDRDRSRSRSPVAARSRTHGSGTRRVASSSQRLHSSHQSPQDSRSNRRESSQVANYSTSALRRDSFSDSNSRHTEESRYRSRSPLTPRGDYRRHGYDVDSDEDEDVEEWEAAILGIEYRPKDRLEPKKSRSSAFRVPKRGRATVESRRREDDVYGYVRNPLLQHY